MKTCGVILAGGRGTRLGELTKVTNKHLLPVGPYPMIYHPLMKLIGAGIEDIMIVSGTEHMGDFVELLGSGKQHGCNLSYRVQDEAGGIAQALGLCERFVGKNYVAVLLGDNVFYDRISVMTNWHLGTHDYVATVAVKKVQDPQRYGVAEFDEKGVLVNIEEKPEKPKNNMAVAGIYLYPPDVFQIIKTLKPSGRGELEITDVNNKYAHDGQIMAHELQGYWTDAGTMESYAHANELVKICEPLF